VIRSSPVAGRRYRLQLIGKQERQAARIAGCWRAVWNAALEQRRVVRQLRRPNVWGVQQMAELPGLKRSEGFEWLGEDAIAQSLQQTLRDLDTAYRRYFAGLGGCPRFKRKGRGESFRLLQGRDLAVRKLNRRWSEVRIAKLGWCRFRLSRPIGGEIRPATVSRDALGWHVSFCVALDQRPAQPHDGPAVGVDRGVAASVALSTGALCRCPELRGRQGKRLLRLRRKAGHQETARRHHANDHCRRSARHQRTLDQIARLSQTCSACGVVDARSRASQTRFRCTACGHAEHADVNPARVILARAVNGHEDGAGSGGCSAGSPPGAGRGREPRTTRRRERHDPPSPPPGIRAQRADEINLLRGHGRSVFP